MMMRKWQYIICGVPLVTLAACLAACAPGDTRYTPFHKDWAQYERHEKAFEHRKARLRGDDEIVLMGGEGGGRAAVYMDEKGRPRLNVGRKTGLSADVDYDGGPEAEVKYKKNWKFVKPQHQGGN